MKRYKYLPFLFHFAFFTVANAQTKTLVYAQELGTVDLKEYGYLAAFDSISQVSRHFLTEEAEFVPFELKYITRSNDCYALKVNIHNPLNESADIYTSSFFNDRVYVYEYDKVTGSFKEQKSLNGYLIPPEDRTVYYSQSSIVSIHLEANSNKTYFLIAENRTKQGKNVARASFKMGFLGYDLHTYRALYDLLSFVNIFMLGIVTILILYNLLIAIWLKDESMGYLVFYNFCYFCWIFFFGGMVIKFNLTDDLYFERNLRYLIPNTFLPLGYGLLFYKFLNLKNNFRFLGQILIVSAILHSILNFSSVFTDYEAVVQMVQILAPVIYISATLGSVLSYLKKHPFSEYFLVGSILMIIGVAVIIYGFSSPNLNYIYGHIFIEVTIFFEIIVFSIAVTNKVWLIKKQSVELAAEKGIILNELEKKNRQLVSFTTQQIEQNDALDKIKSKLSVKAAHTSISVKDFIREIDRVKSFDHNWDAFKVQFDNVNPNFFTILSRDHPKLTSNENRLCALLKMGLRRKEIAGVLGVSVRAVDKALERLKKKLNLNSEIRLPDYINTV